MRLQPDPHAAHIIGIAFRAVQRDVARHLTRRGVKRKQMYVIILRPADSVIFASFKQTGARQSGIVHVISCT
jgi:hypothetical protein